MERTTVDFGIDLGTTNSSIAVLEDTEPKVFKNNIQEEYTPSVVWIDRKGKDYHGRQAKNQIDKGGDAENVHREFKRDMGLPRLYEFKASGRKMTAEELSAEILKSLCGDVLRRTGEAIRAAVIGVPAVFGLPKCQATEAAGRLAGLSYCPLIQEPVAAAMAYGFQSESDRVFWLVYDLGGGTFDAAIIQLRDGQIQVVSHGGDDKLGGKDIDWRIVEDILAPALAREYRLPDFTRGSPAYEVAFCKLKGAAEDAKICLSQDPTAPITIDNIFQDKAGKPIRFEYDLQRTEIEPLIEPVVMRSVKICKKVLQEARLSPGDIQKLILVGGPTLTPILRQILADKLGIALEFRVDPITIVAQGAAVFAGTQRIPTHIASHPVTKGQYILELDYQPSASDPEPLIGGRIVPPEGESLSGFTIELLNSKTAWTSGKIDVSNGTFITKVLAEKGRRNEFLIQLSDRTGKLKPTFPDRFHYTIGTTVFEQILTHSVGLALADGTMDPFFKKGTPLPAKKRNIYRTTVPLRKGDSGTLLEIPAVEGENIRRANRNPLIGRLEIRGDKVTRDLPVGSEVEVIIEIDESRLTGRTKAYIPILDKWFDKAWKLEEPEVDRSRQAADFEFEKARLEQLHEKAQKSGTSAGKGALERIQQEGLVQEVERRIPIAKRDQDVASECEKHLLELKSAIDEAEDVLEWPTLVSKVPELIEWAQGILDKYGEPDDHARLNALKVETEKAIATNDADLLRQKMDELHSLAISIFAQRPEFWGIYFQHILEMSPHWTDAVAAELLIAQGRRARDAGDADGLRIIVRQLIDLLPPDEQEQARAYGSTII